MICIQVSGILTVLLSLRWHLQHLQCEEEVRATVDRIIQVGAKRPTASQNALLSTMVSYFTAHAHDMNICKPSDCKNPEIFLAQAARYPSGNLKSSLESTSGDRLVHWCHGATGLVPLMVRDYKQMLNRYSYHFSNGSQ
jgi:hypothetical protein